MDDIEVQHDEWRDRELDNSYITADYPVQPSHLKDSEIPFIPGATVCDAKRHSDRKWIVVDNVVYDCTQFIDEHPGGQTVIESFVGEDCSWQFWRFHTKRHMGESGLQLRIGRTAGVRNRFPEKPRFVGLQKLHHAQEW